jgi:isoquinoline 1-oxidoreductase beta subunit
VAVYHGFGSYTAVVAQVDATDAPRVTHIVCAIDCGMTVNPDAVRAQVEGGVAFALSAALREEIRVADGAVTQATFADYPILTCAEMPQVDVHVLQSRDAPGGVGEPPGPPVAPAVANAIYAATGRRVRRLPLIPAFYETT